MLNKLIFLLLFPYPAIASEYSSVFDLIQKEGQFMFADGSSYFLFKKDSSFESGPLGISGRSITGTWKRAGENSLVIEGNWSWVNGLSDPNDIRRLTITVYSPFILQPDRESDRAKIRARRYPAQTPLYKCYFIVDELMKMPGKK
jgi:hypothetical protein